MTAEGRYHLPIEGELRNIPPAQRLLREGGICSCFWRLSDGTPVICAMPADVAHEHQQPDTAKRPDCGDPDYFRCPECQADWYERHRDPCSLRPRPGDASEETR